MIAILFSGFLGNLKRTVKAWELCFDKPFIVFIVTESLQKNVMRYIRRKKIRHLIYREDVPTYTEQEIKDILGIHFGGLWCWGDNLQIHKELEEKWNQLCQESSNYTSPLQVIVNYDKTLNRVADTVKYTILYHHKLFLFFPTRPPF